MCFLTHAGFSGSGFLGLRSWTVICRVRAWRRILVGCEFGLHALMLSKNTLPLELSSNASVLADCTVLAGGGARGNTIYVSASKIPRTNSTAAATICYAWLEAARLRQALRTRHSHNSHNSRTHSHDPSPRLEPPLLSGTQRWKTRAHVLLEFLDARCRQIGVRGLVQVFEYSIDFQASPTRLCHLACARLRPQSS